MGIKKIIFVLAPCPDVYCDRKILRLGVGAQMLISIVNFSYIQGFIFRGSYNQGSYNQGFLQSGVLTIRSSYDQGFLQPGVQMNLYYMTSLCPDVDIDRKILRSGVRVDRKLLNLMRIVCSDVDIDLTMSHPCQTRVQGS